MPMKELNNEAEHLSYSILIQVYGGRKKNGFYYRRG